MEKRLVFCRLFILAALGGCSRSYERAELDGTAVSVDAAADRMLVRDQSLDIAVDTRADTFTTPDTTTVCSSRRECDDGAFCNGAENCVAGRCVAGAEPNCNDQIACTIDRCDESVASCVSTPDPALCGNGQTCDAVRGCVGGGCTSDQSCDDNLYCNGFERCLAGACTPGTARVCDDNNRCTDNLCDESARMCRFVRVDVDGDGFSPRACGADDCNDSNPNIRPGVTEECSDRVDNNCNGRIDCDEPSCASLPTCCRPTGRERCDNGIDDNCNGLVDCADRFCRLFPRCRDVDSGMP